VKAISSSSFIAAARECPRTVNTAVHRWHIRCHYTTVNKPTSIDAAVNLVSSLVDCEQIEIYRPKPAPTRESRLNQNCGIGGGDEIKGMIAGLCDELSRSFAALETPKTSAISKAQCYSCG